MPRLAIGPLLHHELAILPHQLPLGVAAKIEIAAVGDPLQLAKFALGEEGKSIFDVGGADGVVGEFVGVVLPQLEFACGETEIEIPLPAAVAPVAVPRA